MAARGADVEDALQVKARVSEVLHVIMMEARQVAVIMVLLEVLVQVMVVKVQEVFLSSLSSTPFPRTRPAARVWAWDAKGSGFPIVLPAPGRRCSGPFS